MRLVIATLRPGQVEAVRQALSEVHVTRLSIADAHAFPEAEGDVAQMAVMEIAVNDDFLERTVSTITAAVQRVDGVDAATGVYVLPIAETIQIYRAVRGQEAI